MSIQNFTKVAALSVASLFFTACSSAPKIDTVSIFPDENGKEITTGSANGRIICADSPSKYFKTCANFDYADNVKSEQLDEAPVAYAGEVVSLDSLDL